MAASRVANSDSFKSSTPSECVIVLTRLFDAPRELVWEAMTKPEHVRRWWGKLDDEHSVPVCEIDLRVGGAWRFVGKGPEGEVTFYGEYKEIAAPSRVVFTEIFAPFPDVPSLVTSDLTVEGEKTRMTVTCEYPSQEVRDMVIGTGMSDGAGKSYDALETLLGQLQR
jgi:uncharacterized protein YndB with AHSA1/START domain